MDAFLHWVFVACATLLAVALVVAWWEHLRSGKQPGPGTEADPAPPRQLAVDVELDTFAGVPPPAPTDSSVRRDALGGALRQASHAGTAPRRGWIDTSPMIGPGARAEPAAAAGTAQDAKSASPN